MADIQKIIEEIGPDVCRECVNKNYGASLEPSDCFYAPVKGVCSHCGKSRHILCGLRISGRIKLFGKRRKI